jgi:catechol 2,3-dioxygenase-like lactoylglutathione lyase family enzyme
VVTIDELHVGDSPDAWRSAGFDVGDDGCCCVGSVHIRLGGGGTGITGWTLRDVPDGLTDIDGVVSRPASPDGGTSRDENFSASRGTQPPSQPGSHPNGVDRIDHLVFMTPDLPRTTAAVVALGLEVRRERDAGAFQQVFFRLGEVILELVGPVEGGPGPASLWGITFAVDDLDATAEYLGERVGRVKDAVQPGRRITTLRGKEIGISPAIAFMSEQPSD